MKGQTELNTGDGTPNLALAVLNEIRHLRRVGAGWESETNPEHRTQRQTMAAVADHLQLLLDAHNFRVNAVLNTERNQTPSPEDHR